jgi:hypothetical protein
MGFQVKSDDLQAYSRQVGRASQDLEQMKRHCHQYSSVGVSNEGLLNLFLTTHTATVQQVSDALAKFQRVLDSAGKELDRSASYYRQTDDATASRIDATYPTVQRIP